MLFPRTTSQPSAEVPTESAGSAISQSPSTTDNALRSLGLDAREQTSKASEQVPRSQWEKMLANDMFSAGFGLMGLGVVVAGLRRSMLTGSTMLQRRLLTTLEIPSTDRAHPWVLDWLAAHAARRGQTRTGIRSHQLSLNTQYTKHPNGASEVAFGQVPGEGTHYIRYRGAWIQVTRERNTRMLDIKSGTPWESVSLTTLSLFTPSTNNIFTALLADAYTLSAASVQNKTVIYSAWGAEWRPLGPARRKRELDSVVLEDGVKERLVQDVEEFLGREKWYADRAIPYRRGYLLSGPPGSGKSSFVQALAGSLGLDICILNLSERGLTDDRLNHLLINAPSRSVVLLEDVDAAFSGRQQTTADGYQSSTTFSGLLNALDGVGAAESRLLFLTTNHPQVLDPALVRPGRVDVHQHFAAATPSQARRLFERFYSGREDVQKWAAEFERRIEEAMDSGKEVSMAKLQGWFIVCGEGMENAVENVGELWGKRVHKHGSVGSEDGTENTRT